MAASLAVVASAPFMGEVRRWIRLEFPDAFVAIVGTALGLATAAAFGWALFRIRERKVERYALLAVAVLLAVAYSRWSSLANPESDAVERVHFVEYGILTWLFYRAWSPLGGFPVVALVTFLSALTVGTLEEWFQWFIPARVGEVRDVFLNAAAIACGLLVSVAVRPVNRPAGPRSRRWSYVFLMSAVTTGALAAFVDAAHIGFEIRDAEAGTFRSIHAAADLQALSVSRAGEWAEQPPVNRPYPVSAEDQYASEGLLHVQARNAAWTSGDVLTAWHENLILERYFAPVLDTRSYVSAAGHRWTREQRNDAERRAHTIKGAATFRSRAEGDFPILIWPRSVFRWLATLLVAFLVAGWVRSRSAE